ncbi:short-subunit dehydrogenase [Agrobacterium tumefaciens]|nr:short-subunit dehydrogenase [Agrobacterium tumefaciens]
MPAEKSIKGFAVVTGASSGIGYELARCAAQDGYNLVIVADETAATKLRAAGTEVEAVQADLSTQAGVEKLLSRIATKERPVDLLFANAGQGLGNGFLDQKMDAIQRVIATNISGTAALADAIATACASAAAAGSCSRAPLPVSCPAAFRRCITRQKRLLIPFHSHFAKSWMAPALPLPA